MKHIYTNIKASFLTLAILLVTVSGFANVIVAEGTTNNYTTFTNNTIIEVYGTLNFNPSYHNGSSQIIIYQGGTMNILKSSLSNMVIDVRSGGTVNISVSNFSFNSNSGFLNAGTINASNTDFTLNSGTTTGLQNSGTFTMKSFTVNSNPPIPSTGYPMNKNTGTLDIAGLFTVNSNGTYENAGIMNVGGAFTNNGAFKTSGTMTANTVTINSPMTLNGTLTVAGNITVNNAITGTNGTLTVTNGVSTMNSNGKFTGINMTFNDLNTTGNDFDTNNSSSKATNTYSKGSIPQGGSVLPLRFNSFIAVEYNQFSVYFKFTTTVESNLKTLQLQGSADGVNYSNIEAFTPHNINGIFNYVSAKIAASTYSSYRIAVINLNGVIEYSNTIFYKPAASTTAKSETSIYPNPVVNAVFNVKVTSAEPAIVRVISNDGRVLSTSVLKGQQVYQVNMPQSAKSSLVNVQVIQNGSSKSFTVLNK